MARPVAESAVQPVPQGLLAAREILIVVGASLLVSLCARFSVPLWWTPVPLTLGNFAVVTVGLALGPRRGFAALTLYLAEGAAGLPVFVPIGPGGIAELLGPTGGYLLAYPFAAMLAGWIAELRPRHFLQLWAGALLAEVAIFLGGIAGLMAVLHVSAGKAMVFGLAPFVVPDLVKTAAAGGAALLLRRFAPRGWLRSSS